MARLSGSWNKIEWKYNKWNVVIDDVAIMKFSSNAITSSVDIDAPGGYAQTLTLTALSVQQNSFSSMTSSIVTSSVHPGKDFVGIPTTRAGSILGLTLYTEDGPVKSGSLSASVTLDGVNTALTLGMNTGSYARATSVKDAIPFTAMQAIGVTLTASATYLQALDDTSGSFMAAVLVEM